MAASLTEDESRRQATIFDGPGIRENLKSFIAREKYWNSEQFLLIANTVIQVLFWYILNEECIYISFF